MSFDDDENDIDMTDNTMAIFVTPMTDSTGYWDGRLDFKLSSPSTNTLFKEDQLAIQDLLYEMVMVMTEEGWEQDTEYPTQQSGGNVIPITYLTKCRGNV
tara:strand:- start:1252 stop:1551 length:300 start_codon:yes stop_codon:yes gene_type:complete